VDVFGTRLFVLKVYAHRLTPESTYDSNRLQLCCSAPIKNGFAKSCKALAIDVYSGAETYERLRQFFPAEQLPEGQRRMCVPFFSMSFC
jgi:hypothetical protein